MDTDTMNNDYYSDGSVQPKSVGGKIVKWVLLGIIILVYVLLMFRIFIKNDPAAAKRFLWTQDTVAAYRQSGDGMKILSQEIETYNRPTEFDENGNVKSYETVTYNTITSDGTFRVSNFLYIPESKEIQVTVRYNRLAVTKLLKAYKLDKRPEGELFFFALEGVAGGDAYATDYQYTASGRFTYEYRRLVFRNVEIAEDRLLYLNVYYINDVTLSAPLTYEKGKPTSVTVTLPLYDSYLGWEDYPMKKALPAEPSEGLLAPPYVLIGK